MMSAARRASLLVVFCLLTSAATTYAERAWVLWKQETLSGSSVVDEKPWELLRAVPTYSTCEATQAEIIKNTAAFWAKAARDAVTVVGNLAPIRK